MQQFYSIVNLPVLFAAKSQEFKTNLQLLEVLVQQLQRVLRHKVLLANTLRVHHQLIDPKKYQRVNNALTSYFIG